MLPRPCRRLHLGLADNIYASVSSAVEICTCLLEKYGHNQAHPVFRSKLRRFRNVVSIHQCLRQCAGAGLVEHFHSFPRLFGVSSASFRCRLMQLRVHRVSQRTRPSHIAHSLASGYAIMRTCERLFWHRGLESVMGDRYAIYHRTNGKYDCLMS